MQVRFSAQPYTPMAKFGNSQTSTTDAETQKKKAEELRKKAADASDGGNQDRAAALYNRANKLDPRQ